MVTAWQAGVRLQSGLVRVRFPLYQPLFPTGRIAIRIPRSVIQPPNQQATINSQLFALLRRQRPLFRQDLVDRDVRKLRFRFIRMTVRSQDR